MLYKYLKLLKQKLNLVQKRENVLNLVKGIMSLNHVLNLSLKKC